MLSISEWREFVRKYLFQYKDGFFELPYMSNSPRTMVQSLKNTPGNEHKVLQNGISTNNPFCDGIIRYRQLDEGFWLLATDITIKKIFLPKRFTTKIYRAIIIF